MLAKKFNATGVLDADISQRTPGERAQVLNLAADLAKGAPVDLAGAKAGYASDKGSLATMQKMRDAVGAFEETATKNLDLALGYFKKLSDTGSPLLNQPLRAINKEGLGDQDTAALNAALRVANTEIAKVTSNPNLTGQLSDSARHEIDNILGGNATLGQALAIGGVLKQDMANRRIALDSGLAGIKSRIGSGAVAPTKEEATGKGAVVSLDEYLKSKGH
jgi:hypothetical protein